MKALVLTLLWLIIATCFVGYGFYAVDYPSRENVLESVIGFGAIGVGVASCVVAGAILLNRFHSQRLTKAWTVVLLLTSSIVSTILPALVIATAAHATRLSVWREPLGDAASQVHLFHGEKGWWLIAAPCHTLWITLIAFGIFVACVFDLAHAKT
jgi:hypothetical protein